MSISTEGLQQWFAVQVWVGRERLSAVHLRTRGYDVLLPCYRELRRWSDRVRKVERALFSGYVFCRSHGDALGKIVTSPGVIRIVGVGGAPMAIPEPEMAAIQRIVTAQLDAKPCPFVQAGQRVRIVVGPMRDTEGLVLRTKSGSRVVVSISLLQRSVAVDVDMNCLSVEPGEGLAVAGLG